MSPYICPFIMFLLLCSPSLQEAKYTILAHKDQFVKTELQKSEPRNKCLNPDPCSSSSKEDLEECCRKMGEELKRAHVEAYIMREHHTTNKALAEYLSGSSCYKKWIGADTQDPCFPAQVHSCSDYSEYFKSYVSNKCWKKKPKVSYRIPKKNTEKDTKTTTSTMNEDTDKQPTDSSTLTRNETSQKVTQNISTIQTAASATDQSTQSANSNTSSSSTTTTTSSVSAANSEKNKDEVQKKEASSKKHRLVAAIVIGVLILLLTAVVVPVLAYICLRNIQNQYKTLKQKEQDRYEKELHEPLNCSVDKGEDTITNGDFSVDYTGDKSQSEMSRSWLDTTGQLNLLNSQMGNNGNINKETAAPNPNEANPQPPPPPTVTTTDRNLATENKLAAEPNANQGPATVTNNQSVN